MEILSSLDCLKCSKHSNQNIIFIQVNQIQDNKHIFYCATCVLYDDEFKNSNYIQYQSVLESSNNSNIVNWPPFNDNSIKNQVSKILSNDQSLNRLISKINKFYDDMKTVIISKINDCQKSLIKQAQEFPQYENQIKEKLQQIKLVDSFKNILLNRNSKMRDKDRQWREFINQVNKEMQSYTKEIKQILDLIDYKKKLIDFETPNKIIVSILQLIEDINIIQKGQQLNEQKQNNNIDLLPDLQMIQSSFYQDGSKNQKIQKLENNNIQIISLLKTRGSYYSNLVLDRNKKYMFRFQFQLNDQQLAYFNIGLVFDETKDIQQFYKDKLAFLILQSRNTNGHLSKDGIDKCVKGDLSEIKYINCLELRVCLKDELLEVVDYPNYNHKYVINDQYKINFQKYQNLRLAIFLASQIQLTLISANICDMFQN